MSAAFRLRVRGRSGHASTPGIADNALVKAAPHIGALGAYRPAASLIPEVERFFEVTLGERSSARRRRSHARGRARPAAAEFVQPLLSLTLSPTMIEASQARNVIPAVCDVTVDCRLLPGQLPEHVEPELRARLGAGRLGARVDRARRRHAVGARHPALVGARRVRRDDRARRASPAERATPGSPTATTCGRRSGRPRTASFPCARWTPSSPARLEHSADERVPRRRSRARRRRRSGMPRCHSLTPCSSCGRRTGPSSRSRRGCASVASSHRAARTWSLISSSATGSPRRSARDRRRSPRAVPCAAAGGVCRPAALPAVVRTGAATPSHRCLGPLVDARRVRRRRRERAPRDRARRRLPGQPRPASLGAVRRRPGALATRLSPLVDGERRRSQATAGRSSRRRRSSSSRAGDAGSGRCRSRALCLLDSPDDLARLGEGRRRARDDRRPRAERSLARLRARERPLAGVDGRAPPRRSAPPRLHRRRARCARTSVWRSFSAPRSRVGP